VKFQNLEIVKPGNIPENILGQGIYLQKPGT